MIILEGSSLIESVCVSLLLSCYEVGATLVVEVEHLPVVILERSSLVICYILTLMPIKFKLKQNSQVHIVSAMPKTLNKSQNARYFSD